MSDAPVSPSDVSTRGTSRRLPRTRQEIQNRRRRFVTWAIVISSTILMVDALVGQNGYLAKLRARRDNAALVQQRYDLQQENLRLAEQADRLKHDPNAIEAAARRDLDLMKPGEVMVVVHEAASPAPTVR